MLRGATEGDGGLIYLNVNVPACPCEDVKRPKQSHFLLENSSLPRSLRSLAMTGIESETRDWEN